MKGTLPWWVRWACRAGTRDFCSSLAALVGPVQNIFFPNLHYNLFVPVVQQAGQAVVLGRMSLSMCLWLKRKGQTKRLYKKVQGILYTIQVP
jgi:hypothetical protein